MRYSCTRYVDIYCIVITFVNSFAQVVFHFVLFCPSYFVQYCILFSSYSSLLQCTPFLYPLLVYCVFCPSYLLLLLYFFSCLSYFLLFGVHARGYMSHLILQTVHTSLYSFVHLKQGVVDHNREYILL